MESKNDELTRLSDAVTLLSDRYNILLTEIERLKITKWIDGHDTTHFIVINALWHHTMMLLTRVDDRYIAIVHKQINLLKDVANNELFRKAIAIRKNSKLCNLPLIILYWTRSLIHI